MKSPFVCTIYLIGEQRFSISITTRKQCNFTNEGQKSLQPKLAKRSFQTLSGVNLYPSNKNISNDDGEYTGNHLSSTTYVDFTPDSGNHHQRKDFPMKIGGLTSMTHTILCMHDLSFMAK